MKKKEKSFDSTRGYRPPVRESSRGQKSSAPELQEPLPGVQGTEDESARPVGSPRKRQAMTGALLAAGLVVILGFSLVSLLATSYTGPPLWQEDDPVQAATWPGRGQAGEEEAEVAEGIRLEVEGILQEPELPNGCEATSLAILLNHYGYRADKIDIADNYLVKEDFWAGEWGEMYGPDPEAAYPGAPGPDMLGYYCYPGVIIETAGSYIEAHQGPHAAEDLSGATTRRLRGLLDEGVPVIVWCTTDLLPRRTTVQFHWYFSQGAEPYYPYVNMHAMVLTGYDSQYYYFCDPLDEHNKVARTTFDDNYIEVGRRAVALMATEEP